MHSYVKLPAQRSIEPPSVYRWINTAGESNDPSVLDSRHLIHFEVV